MTGCVNGFVSERIRATAWVNIGSLRLLRRFTRRRNDMPTAWVGMGRGEQDRSE
jgi:hypothetical protein